MNNNQGFTKYFKILALIAVLLIVVGVTGAWVLSEHVGGSTTTLEETVNVEGVLNVSIRSTIQRIRVRAIAGNEARVISSGIPANATLIAEVEDGVLTIETRLPRQMTFGIHFGGFGLFTDSPTLDVYLPSVVYEQVTINSTTGRVEIADFSINDLQIEVTTGGIELSDIVGNVNVRTSTGRITATRMVGEHLHFRATTGAINLSDLTGDVDAQTSTGRITFENATIAQNVNLQTTTGGVNVNLETEPENAMFSLTTTTGGTTVFGNNSGGQQFGDGRYEVTLRTTTGRITVE